MAAESNMSKFELPSCFNKLMENEESNELEWLSKQHNCISLVKACPSVMVADYLSKILGDVVLGENILHNQYTRFYGHPSLVHTLSRLYSKPISRPINPMTEILITAGATEALYCAVNGFVNEGDEVIIIQPYLKAYEQLVNLAGGTCVFVDVKLNEFTSTWDLDLPSLTSAFNHNTKMIILNTPQYPIGKVYMVEELTTIAKLCVEFKVVCVVDESYEWILYDGMEHNRIANLPGMWDSTVTISSSSKCFGVEGWRIGWAYGEQKLIRNLQIAHQHSLNVCATPLQESISRFLSVELDLNDTSDLNSLTFFKTLPKELQTKRDYLHKQLTTRGIKCLKCEGGYYLTVCFHHNNDQIDTARWLIESKNIEGIPLSSCYYYNTENQNKWKKYICLCFAQSNEILHKVVEKFDHEK